MTRLSMGEMYSMMIRGHSLATVSEASTTNATATSSGGALGVSVAMLSVAADEEVVVGATVIVFVRRRDGYARNKKSDQISKNGNPLEMYFKRRSTQYMYRDIIRPWV